MANCVLELSICCPVLGVFSGSMSGTALPCCLRRNFLAFSTAASMWTWSGAVFADASAAPIQPRPITIIPNMTTYFARMAAPLLKGHEHDGRDDPFNSLTGAGSGYYGILGAA